MLAHQLKMSGERADNVALHEGDGDRFDDDDIKLPADTLAILTEFLQNKNKVEQLERQTDGNNSITTFEEDWQLSQFWYNDETKRTLTKVCLKLILAKTAERQPTIEVRVALLSCPSLYKSIKSIHPNGIVRLFEFDERFAAFSGDFVPYDYRNVHKHSDYMDEYRQYFDIIISDPPFLSEECIQSTGQLVNKIKKDDTKIVLCSGQAVADWAKEFLHLDQCDYRPQHERNLANEFRSYANFQLDEMIT